MSKTKRKEKGYYFAVAVLLILAIISMFPLLLVLMNSFKTHAEIARNPLSFPTTFNLDNYIYTWQAGNFGRGFVNSLKLTGSAVITGVLVATSMGYVLATRRIRTWKPLTQV